MLGASTHRQPNTLSDKIHIFGNSTFSLLCRSASQRPISSHRSPHDSPISPATADTSAVRATFIIDPEGILRAMVYYPMSNGRSISEFVRLVSAMQTSDTNGVATPEAWQPGDQVIVPPPADMDAAQARMNEGYECKDWYFCKKAIGWPICGDPGWTGISAVVRGEER
jgi:hypothetical protein